MSEPAADGGEAGEDTGDEEESDAAIPVRLLGVPVADYLQLEAHNDAMAREFALLTIDAADPNATVPVRIAEVARGLEHQFSAIRPAFTAAIRAAAERGDASVDLDLSVTSQQADALEDAQALLEEADDICRSGALLTTPTPPPLVALRRWFVRDIVAQVRGRRGPTQGPSGTSAALLNDPLTLLQAIPDAVIAADAAGRVVYTSAGVERLLGWPPGALIGLPIESLSPERIRPLHRAAFRHFIDSGFELPAGRSARLRVLRQDGGEIEVDATLAPFRTLHGQDLLVSSIRPVSSDGATRERLLQLLESLGGVVWEAEAGTLQPLFVSDGVVDLLQLPLTDALTQPGPFAERIDPADRDRVLGWRRAALEAGEPPSTSIDYRAITPHGDARWIRDRVAVLDGADGHRRLLGLSVDITDERLVLRRGEGRGRVGTALATAETLREALPAILSAIGEGWGFATGAFWLIEGDAGDHRQIRAVRSWTAPGGDYAEFDAFTLERALRRGVGLPGRVWESEAPAWIADTQTDDNLPRARVALAAGLHSAVGVPVMVNGELVGVLEFFAHPARGPEPRTLSDLSAIAMQIGLFLERRRAEDELRFQKALLEWQSEAALDGIIVVSDDGDVLSYNQRFIDMSTLPTGNLGAGDAAMVLESALKLLADPETFMMFLLDAREDGQPRRTEVDFVDGRIIDCYVAALPAPAGRAAARAWYFRDITDRKRAELKLQSLAQTLQRSLLPPVAPHIPGLDVATRYRFAGAGLDVGGDFYDVFQTGAAWGVVIGDVCGKGASAASLTALVRYTARGAAMRDTDPSEVLRRVNEAVVAEPLDDRLCTVTYARLEPVDGSVTVTAASGGHPLALVLRASGAVESLGRPGTVLGAFEVVDTTDTVTALQPGDALVLYTDGVSEARRDTEFFGVDRLVDLLATLAGRTAQEVVDAVADTVIEFQRDDPRDDIAVVAVRLP